MPFNFLVDLEQLSGVLLAVVAIVAATLTALWIALIIWTYRDMKSRSRDPFAQIMAALVVAILNIPGLLVYLILRPQETLAEQYERALEEEALLQEIEGKSVCPGCGSPIKQDWRLCPYCHTKLKKPCEACSELLELSWTVCPYCEAPQIDAARRANPRRSGREQAPHPHEQAVSSLE
ncbi:MAG: zinc ribbon domain-containing protein [Chloroflexi bacterium]|nr:zinc ribbon domain-containing protein [Chloroflexota bacterium]